MRILYWTAEDLRRRGGGSTHVLEIVRHLGLQGHTVVLCTPSRALPPGPLPNTISVGVPVFGPKTVRMLWFELSALLVIPYLRIRRKVDVTYSRFSPLTVTAPVVCKLLRIPYVAEFNGLTGQELAMMGRNRWLARFADAVDRFNFRMATRSICVTAGIRSSLVAATGKDPELSAVIGNGADVDTFHPLDRASCRDALGLEREDFWIGFVGSIARWQGVDLLTQAVKELHRDHPNLGALIVGDGAMRAELEAAVMGCDFIRFTGRVPHDFIPTYLGAMDVAFLCKRGLAGGFSPLKLYEYMAAARPVICNRAEGLTEVVSQGCGFLFDADDPATLREAIQQSMLDADLLPAMGQRARALVLRDHTWEALARRTADILKAARSAAS